MAKKQGKAIHRGIDPNKEILWENRSDDEKETPHEALHRLEEMRMELERYECDEHIFREKV